MFQHTNRHRARQAARALGALAALALLVCAPARAQQVRVDITRAEAINKHDDTVCGIFCPWWNQQDFYNWVKIDSDPDTTSPVVDQRDVASWNPSFNVMRTLDPLQRFSSVQLQLWDDDDTSGDDLFDIDFFASDRTLNVQFDACLGTWTDTDETYGPVRAPSTADPGNQVPTVPHRRGFDSDPAKIDMGISLEGNIPGIPMDVRIAQAGPIQVVTSPARIIAGKPTVFRLDLGSSWGEPRNAVVTVSVSDQISLFEQTRSIVVPPGESTHYFFDGVSGADPFVPQKFPNNPHLTWTVSMDVDGEVDCVSTVDPILFQDWGCCNLENNTLVAGVGSGALPIVITTPPRTVYLPFDWITPTTPDEPTDADMASFIDVSERFREATFPIASPAMHEQLLPSEFILRDAPGRCPFGFCAEPYATTLKWSRIARRAGIGTLVLSVAPNWITRRIEAGETVGFLAGRTPTGMTLAEFSPNCVLAQAEPGTTAPHEIAHTFELSQRDCVPTDPFLAVLETIFPTLGCRDEYMFSDGRPYLAEGYDVQGLIYPNGFSGPGSLFPAEPACSPVTPGSREVKCATNLMDLGTREDSAAGIQNWIDAFSYNWLTEKMMLPGDPTLISIEGMITTPTGHDAMPPQYEGELGVNYIFDGIPDMPEPDPGKASGSGFFAVRLVTPAGTRTYRFDPAFNTDGTGALDTTYFALTVPWDDTTTSVELLGPTDVTQPGQNQDVVLASMDRTPAAPQLAGLTVEGGSGQQQLPAILPGGEATLRWDVIDPDSPTTWSMVELLLPAVQAPDALNGYLPVAVDVDTGELPLTHDMLAGRPGTYGARITVSDGINTATVEQPALFSVCALSNGGVEICDGIDNDCNGVIDDAVTPVAADGLAVEPTTIDWTPMPGAESYDVVRGDLMALRAAGGDLGAASVECLALDETTTTIAGDVDPAPGQAAFYLVRGSNCQGDGTWDATGSSQAASRDAAVDAAVADCASCAHDICVAGAALEPTCGECAAAICDADSYCCTTEWDSICVEEVAGVCGLTCS